MPGAVYLYQIRYPVQLILNISQRSNFLFRFFEVESLGIIRVEFLDGSALNIALLEVLVVIQVAVV